MQVHLENIGIIRNSTLEIDSLTVITGTNDTGKSTLGKILFSLIKAFSRYEEDLEVGEKEKVKKIYTELSNIYYRLRKEFDVELRTNKNIESSFASKELASPIDNYSQLNKFLDVQSELSNNLRHHSNINDVELKSLIDRLEDMSFIFDKNSIYSQRIDKIKAIYGQEYNKTDLMKRALEKSLVSEFYSDLSYSGNSKVSCSEGQNKLVEFEIENGKVKHFNYFDDLRYNEVTFIESPTILHLFDSLKYANTRFEVQDKNYSLYSNRGIIAFHVKDLVSKLEKAGYLDDIDIRNDYFQRSLNDYAENLGSDSNVTADMEPKTYPLIIEISQIINGDVGYSKQFNDFVYHKKLHGRTCAFKSSNIATGIKSFGILQLLLKADFLNERHLLIIDEPESNLHPEWQLKYAQIIIKLVKYGIPVLVTTHSPYMVQALSVFSKKEGVAEQTKFYFAENKDSYSEIRNVTEDLREIFAKLTKPFEELVWS